MGKTTMLTNDDCAAAAPAVSPQLDDDDHDECMDDDDDVWQIHTEPRKQLVLIEKMSSSEGNLLISFRQASEWMDE